MRDLMPYDDGVEREVPTEVSLQWGRLIRQALALRAKEQVVRLNVSPEAREIFRLWHNEAVDLRNTKYREEENKLARARENAIRIANNLAAAELVLRQHELDRPVLTKEHAEGGIALARFFLQTALNLTGTQRAMARARRLERIEGVLRFHAGRERLHELERNHKHRP
jgi:hypothetical protein